MTEREIFFEAIEIGSATEREAYVRGACGKDVELRRKVDELLKEHYSNDSLMAGPAVAADGLPTALDDSPVIEGPGSQIGRYKLLQKLGEGGFGVVYMAEQKEPVRRRIALKIIKLGMDTKQVVARFEAERQALAMMDHPNIAKVLDAGATDTGRPYFVMELVKGIPITKYCDENKLTSAERLNLFMSVCAAIQHAHQKGIIHRDIKPSNIMITLHDGVPVPKVIDFGIAKATQQELTEKTIFTQYSQFIGTPAYMSPEQAEMSGLDIDTRSDIYSLGVLLYELLTGRTPLDSKELLSGGYDEIRRRIKEEEPFKPSTRVSTMMGDERTDVARLRRTEPSKLSHQLRGDLDWMVMKALEKDRTRRYETANAFRLDVERFLKNEPVTAVAPSVAYTLKKFVSRNKLAFGAVAAIASGLIIGISVATWQAVRAHRSAVVANQRTDEALAARNEALDARQEEHRQRMLAETNERRARELHYASDMVAISNAVRDRDTKLGFDLLDAHIPSAGKEDLRDWDWRFLRGQFSEEQDGIRCLSGAHEMAVSADGRFLAVAGGSRAGAVVLSFPDLKIQRNLRLPTGVGWISGMFFSADGAHLMIEPYGQPVLKFDLLTGERFDVAPKDFQAGRITIMTPDEKWVIVMHGQVDTPLVHHLECVRIQDGYVAGNTEPFKVPDPYMLDHEVRISPDGTKVTATVRGGLVRIFSIPGLQEFSVIDTTHDVAVVAWSPDGKTLATGLEYPYEFDLWDVESGNHVGDLEANLSGPALDIDFARDGSKITGVALDNTIYVWRAATLELLQTFIGHRDNRTPTAAFLGDHKTLASLGRDGTVKLWDTSVADEMQFGALSEAKGLWNLKYSPDGRQIAAVGSDGIVYMFDSQTERLLFRLEPDGAERGNSPIYKFPLMPGFTSDGRILVAGNGDETATVYDVQARRSRFVLKGHTKPIITIRISPDDRIVATTGEENVMILWDIDTGDQINQFDGPRCVDFHPDSTKRLVAVRERSSVSLINIDTGERVSKIAAGSAWSTTFSPDGRTLAVGRTGSVSLYRMPNLELEIEIQGLHGPVPTVAFHPDGNILAFPTWGGSLHLWNRKVKRLVGRLPLPKDWTVEAHFSPDGNTLAVSTRGQGNRLYRAPTMTQIQDWKRQEERDEKRIAQSRAKAAADEQRAMSRFETDPGSVNQWLLLGPVPIAENDNREARNLILDEAALEPRSGDAMQIGGVNYIWEIRKQNNPILDFLNIYQRLIAEKLVVYAVSYIVAERDMENLTARIGSDDLSTLYLNGTEIYQNVEPRSFRLDQDRVDGVKLVKGRNLVVFKVVNNVGDWGGSVRFTDADGNQMEGLQVTLDPEENNSKN